MRAKSLGVWSAAVLFAATIAFAQNSTTDRSQDQNSTTRSSDQNSSSSSANAQSDASNPSGVKGNMMTGRVTKYTPGQSITVRMRDGQTKTWDLTSKSETANIDPSVKVGSRVQISETDNNGTKTLSVQPANAGNTSSSNTGAASSDQSASNAGADQSNLPKTASNTPLLGLIGLLSLAAAAGMRLFAKNNA